MVLRTVFVSFLLLIVMRCSSQTPPMLTSHRCYGGTNEDRGNSIRRTVDGGYIFCGITSSGDSDVSGFHGGTDGWIVKVDVNGDIEWQRSLGGTSGDDARSVQQTSDGGYIIAGISWSNDGDVSGVHGLGDIWVVKLTVDGSIDWQRAIGGSHEDFTFQIIETAEGGYALLGYTFSNDGDVTDFSVSGGPWLIKLNSDGGMLWQRTFPGGLHSIQQTPDLGYILSGSSAGPAPLYPIDARLLKLNSLGETVWERTYGGSENDGFSKMERTSDGGYVAVGWTNSLDGDVTGNHGGGDVWIVKTNDVGDLEWQSAIGGTSVDGGLDITISASGGYYVLANVYSTDGDLIGFQGPQGVWLVKLDSVGAIVWRSAYVGNCVDFVSSAEGFVVLGHGGWFGDFSCNLGTEHSDIWIAQYTFSEVGISERSSKNLILSPNPVSSILSVRSDDLPCCTLATIKDLLGRDIFQQRIQDQTSSIDCTGMASGMYTLSVLLPSGLVTKVFVVE